MGDDMNNASVVTDSPMINIDIPFAVSALARLPMKRRGTVMMAVMQAACSCVPTDAEKALLTLFTGRGRRHG